MITIDTANVCLILFHDWCADIARKAAFKAVIHYYCWHIINMIGKQNCVT
jgi:hypothetical protein